MHITGLHAGYFLGLGDHIEGLAVRVERGRAGDADFGGIVKAEFTSGKRGDAVIWIGKIDVPDRIAAFIGIAVGVEGIHAIVLSHHKNQITRAFAGDVDVRQN